MHRVLDAIFQRITNKSLLAIIAIILLCLWIDFFPIYSNNSKTIRSIYCNPALLADGDIIFRKGRSLVSEAVLTSDGQSPYSHVGIIKIINDNVMVIHAVPSESPGEKDLVKIDALPLFLSYDRASMAAIYRLDQIDKDAQACAIKASNIALSYAEQQIPFDNDFDLNTKDSLYCTEMVWRAYQGAGIDLVDGKFDNLAIPMSKGAYILPSSLLKSHWVKKIALLTAEE